MKKIFLLLLWGLLCGCSSLQRNFTEKPKVELDHVYLRDPSLTGATIMVVLEVSNPNKVDLKVDEVNYEIFLDQKFFSKAKTAKAVLVPAGGTEKVELPLPIEYSQFVRGAKKLLFGEKLEYRIKGNAKVSLFSIPFEQTGSFGLHGDEKEKSE